MKRAVLALTMAVLFSPAAGLRADEPATTKLEFVRKLREKGYADLALQYLEKLRKAPPAELAGQLPLEMARTRVALARQKEPTQRAAQFDEARKELQTFIEKNPTHAEVPHARVELARLAAYQGQALLSQSIRTEDSQAANALARSAEEKFIQAGKELKAAADALPKDDDRVQVEFERAKNFLDQASTHPYNRKRAELVDEARKALEEVEKTALKNLRNPALHLARAWLIKAYQEGDAPDKASAYFKTVIAEEVKQARPGQRLAWYFRIKFIPKDLKIKGTGLDKLKQVQKEARAWLKTFPSARSTPEGYGVRFELANALITEARELSKDPKTGKVDPKSPRAAKLYAQAQQELDLLTRSDNDFAEKASQMSLAISFQKMGEKTAVELLKDFDQCYLKARYEMFKMQDTAARLAKATPAEREALEAERKQHLRTAIKAFQRGLKLADDRTPFGQLAETRYYLSYIFLMAQDPYRAAIMAEDLARTRPPTKRSAAAAGYALQAYSSIASATKRPNDVERMRDLANFIIKDNQVAWKDEPVSQVARYQLAVSALLEKKYLDAVTLLEQVSPTYPAYTYSQAQLVLAAAAGRRGAEDPKLKQLFQAKLTAALERMPRLSEGADLATAQMYFAAQLEKGNTLYFAAYDHGRKNEAALALKKYGELRAFAADLKQQYDKHARRLPEDVREQFAGALKQMQNLALYGICQADYRAGEYDKVLAPDAAGQVVAEVRKLAGKGDGPIQVTDAKQAGEILGLAMRASVQKGKIEQAKEILHLLRRLAGEEKGGEQAGAVLQTLVLELKSQVRELKDKGQKAQLDATVKNFSQFLDELGKEPGRKMTRDNILFLAGCYASLDKYAEAAKLYAQIPAPNIDLKKKKYTPQEEKELQDYWLLQVAYGRALRLGKQFSEARKVLNHILSEPKARGRFLAEKEDIHLLEDQGLYGTAVGRWTKYQQHPAMLQALKTLGQKDATEQRRIKELYYDCVYQFTFCMYMYGKNNKVPAKRDQYIQRAAAKVVQMEGNRDAWEVVGDKFRALLRSEPPLMTAYNREKAKAAPAGK